MADDDKNTDEEIKDLTQPGERLDPQRVKAEEGTWESAARRLANKVNTMEADLKQERDRRRKAEDAAPAEGDELLTGDEAERYRSIEAPDGSTALETLQSQAQGKKQAETELAQVKRKEELRDFAAAMGDGFNFEALEAHANGEAYEVREETDGDGNEVKRGYVTPEATEDNPNPETVAIRDYDKFKHVRLFDDKQEEATRQRPSVPNQRPGGNAPDSGNSLVSDYLDQNYPSNSKDD